MSESLHLTRNGPILEITLDRPKANAIDAKTSFAMGEAFLNFRDDPELRVAIITGGGEKFFSAGWDLKAAAEGEAPEGLALAVFRELDEYFQGKRKTFDIPLRTHGTAFQEKVWAALRAIPYGEVRSYKEVAEAIGHPRAYRAVGMANNANPIFIIVPCHRVIGSDGSLTGYGGGLSMKRALLSLERGNRIS